jgi:hypothetical protein
VGTLHEEEKNCHSKKLISGHLSQKGLDVKTSWLTDHRLQCNFDFNLDFDIVHIFITWIQNSVDNVEHHAIKKVFYSEKGNSVTRVSFSKQGDRNLHFGAFDSTHVKQITCSKHKNVLIPTGTTQQMDYSIKQARYTYSRRRGDWDFPR